MDQGLDGLYGIGSHELDATLGKVSGYEVANGDGVEVETIVVGKALKAGDVDCTKTGQGDVTGEIKQLDDGSKVAVSDEDETAKIASLVAGGSEKSVPGKLDKFLLVSRDMQQKNQAVNEFKKKRIAKIPTEAYFPLGDFVCATRSENKNPAT